MVIKMPIITKKGLPVNAILKQEKLQILEELPKGESSYFTQIAILNLMPLKEDTELQLLRKLGAAQKNIKVTFVNVSSYVGTHTKPEHMQKYYTTFEQIKKQRFDGLIITGAPVEQIEFEKVAYWEELTKIMEWSKENVKSTLYICWGAQAGLYHFYNIPKVLMPYKQFGIFEHEIKDNTSNLLKEFKQGFKAPHSRHTTIERLEIEKHPELTIVSESKEAGVFIVENKKAHQIFITGHLEYALDTLDKEYKRDLGKGLNIQMPQNYYEEDDPNKEPIFSWRQNGDRIYSNWVNYYL